MITCSYESFLPEGRALRLQHGLWLLIRLTTVPPSVSDELLLIGRAATGWEKKEKEEEEEKGEGEKSLVAISVRSTCNGEALQPAAFKAQSHTAAFNVSAVMK